MSKYLVEFTLTVEVDAGDSVEAVEKAKQLVEIDDAYIYMVEQVDSSTRAETPQHLGVAQMVERMVWDHEAASSRLATQTKM